MKRCGLLLLPAVLGSCAWLVPDREQEYRKVRPLPALKLPAELDTSPALTVQPPAALPEQPPSAALSAPANAPYIELDLPFASAWARTLKALNLLKLEPVGRDLKAGHLELIYTQEKQNLAEDRGLWEDLLYFVTGKAMREEKYLLLLEPIDDRTRLYLLDPEGRPRTDPSTLHLLERIKQTVATVKP
ncbi:hypothetical protein JCM13664_17540 [Methylothermus subterraneus]